MQLFFRAFGQGTAVIIVHGLFGMSDNWQTFARKLAFSHTVYTVDLRNHGNSPHSDVFNYEVMALDLKEFMDAQGIRTAVLLGHSMGGKVVMKFADLFPGHVERMVIVDIGLREYEAGHDFIFGGLLAMNLHRIETRGEADAILRENISSLPIRQFLLKNLKRKKDGGFEWKMNLTVIYENYQEIINRIELDEIFDKDVLFIKGGKSTYINDEDMSLIEAHYPKAQIKTIEQAGHWVHSEAPEEFLDLVTTFATV